MYSKVTRSNPAICVDIPSEFQPGVVHFWTHAAVVRKHGPGSANYQ
jgi:hypothetical protein